MVVEPVSVRDKPPTEPVGRVATLWKRLDGGKILCTACARYCKIGEGQTGLCGIRGVLQDKLWLYVYGKIITGHVDPIEKKPVIHYRPGSKVFSIATTGCNWLCRYCFLPGTRILTDRGHEKIEDIFLGATLTSNPELRSVEDRTAYTHRGRWRRVRKAFQHLYSGKVLTVRPYYLPAIECTPDHRVFASIGGRGVEKVKARELKVGDFLAIPRPSPGRDESVLDVEGLLTGRVAPAYKGRTALVTEQGRIRWSSERGHGVPAKLRLTPRLARLLGYYCAEGSVNWHPGRPNSGAVWFSFSHLEEERMREVERLLMTVFRGKARRVRQRSRVAVIAPGASLAALFKQLCGDSSATKRVPAVILQTADSSTKRAFLAGYLNGDGYVTSRKGGGVILGSSSISTALTYGVAHLVMSLGDVPRIYLARNEPEYVIEGRTVSRSDDVMLRLWADRVAMTPEVVAWQPSRIRVIETPEYFLVPIRSIEDRDYVGPVYNLEVEEDHSYTANFAAVANCQNFDISQRRKIEGIDVEPQDVVRMTLEQGCQGLAYTYNQPTIWIEFARDIGVAARKAGLFNIFVSNGYDTPETVGLMGDFLDCITVDFKGSGETNFVRKYINIPNADPIFQTIQEMRDKTKIHIEITDLIVPRVGDDLEACRKLSRWVLDELGPDVPIHFLRFHPDYKMMDFEWTPVETLVKHCDVAREAGLRYVYIGNVPGHRYEHTYCPGCGKIAVKRYGFDITGWYLDRHNRCKACGYQLPIQGGLERTVNQDRFYGVLLHR